MALSNKDKDSMKFWLEFIQMYKEHPCLWDPTGCHEYYNKTHKQLAYNILLEKYWELEPTATVECIRKKIMILRSGFLREYRRIREAKQANNKAVTKLWYYQHLKFIRPKLDNDSDDDVMLLDSDGDSISQYSDNATEDNELMQDFPDSSSTAQPTYPGLPIISTVSTLATNDIEIEIPGTSTNHELEIKTEAEDTEQDDCSTFASHVETRMRRFDPEQKLIARKLITDIMFMADTKQLQMTSTILNPHFLSAPHVVPQSYSPPPKASTSLSAYEIESIGDGDHQSV